LKQLSLQDLVALRELKHLSDAHLHGVVAVAWLPGRATESILQLSSGLPYVLGGVDSATTIKRAWNELVIIGLFSVTVQVPAETGYVRAREDSPWR